MDGDGPDLPALRALCDEYDAALLVDEAHALGVFGPEGSGRCRDAGITPDVLVGTLGKAVGVQGAFVAGSARLRELLWNRARSFVFSTAPSPLLAEVARFHVEHTRAADGARETSEPSLRRAPRRHSGAGPHPGSGFLRSHRPVLIGDEQRSVAVAERLASEGIVAQAIRPPTVPSGTSRLRLTAKATWGEDSASIVAGAISRALAP